VQAELATQYGQERLPRYTSYPTAPHFSPAIDANTYLGWLKSMPSPRTASLYLHVPFCRVMCWYCGCHTSVTKQDEPIKVYTSALRCEIKLIADALQKRIPVAHIHFGGGTPTIMAAESFSDLVTAMRTSFFVLPNAEIAVEIDPRTLTERMSEAMGYCGVARASLGVQSFDPHVQRAINRSQTVEQTEAAVYRLRRASVRGINFDLIYGLPHQTVASCLDTVERCVALRPDRFAVFGYAHVPSFKKHQRKIAEAALPDSFERHRQFETIAEALERAGYIRIGLDHFALPTDPMAVAQREQRLRRNFQGYTDDPGDVLIGLGASAIGQLPQGFVQNVVATRDYLQRTADGKLATAKGYALTADDRFRADIIERIMCDFAVDLAPICRHHGRSVQTAIVDHERFGRLVSDGVVTMKGDRLEVIDDFRFLARSVASIFDAHLPKAVAAHSRAV
jgi:oxygen-independent coproporphyrinogen-3 oxidase